MSIFFDLDGTLIDVAPRHYKVYETVVAEFHGRALSQAVYWELKRKKAKWPELLTRSELDAALEQEFLASFIEKIEAIPYLKIDKPFPSTLKVLDSLSKKHQCYLVSLRRNRKNLLEQIAWLGLSSYFTKILTGHSESDGYDVKMSLLRRYVTEGGIIIGDTEADIIAGKELCLTTIALNSGIRDEQFLSLLQPDYLLPGIRSVPELPLLQ